LWYANKLKVYPLFESCWHKAYFWFWTVIIQKLNDTFNNILLKLDHSSECSAINSWFRTPGCFSRLLFVSSIFSAETKIKLLALKFVASFGEGNSWHVRILFLALWQLRFVKLKTLIFIYSTYACHFHIFIWVCIHWKTIVDQEAKDALDNLIFNYSVPDTDY
jgi:hypothetical protein